MGVSQEIAQAVQDTGPAPDFEVMEENWPAVELFMRLQTQWVPMMGGVIGLNYQSVEFLFRIEDVKDQREMLADLQAMEIAALEVINARE